MNPQYLARQIGQFSFDELKVFLASVPYLQLSKDAPEAAAAIQARDPELFQDYVRAYDRPLAAQDIGKTGHTGRAFIRRFEGKTLDHAIKADPTSVMKLRENYPSLYAQLKGNYLDVPIPSLQAMGLADPGPVARASNLPASTGKGPTNALGLPVLGGPHHISEIIGRSRFGTVQARSNREADLMLYGTISQWEELNAKDFHRKITDLSKNYQRINLRIHSPGGSVNEGFAMCTSILNSSAEIHTYIDGVAASMASAIAICGRTVNMSNTARMMIHQSSTAGRGGADDLRRAADEMDKVNGQLADLYAAKTGNSKDWILKNWMQAGKDKWFSADEAKKAGLVDEVFTGKIPAPAKAEYQSFEGIAAYFSEVLAS